MIHIHVRWIIHVGCEVPGIPCGSSTLITSVEHVFRKAERLDRPRHSMWIEHSHHERGTCLPKGRMVGSSPSNGSSSEIDSSSLSTHWVISKGSGLTVPSSGSMLPVGSGSAWVDAYVYMISEGKSGVAGPTISCM